ncbi:Zinc finger CCHC-type superfamily [Arabidopsis thaliana x Arabidopsis arenosa]|uniref:Zinc finger CCHC-type superfamily n=1 Tax=Arabidopsis thaliana x Arabidopsis arenosa TaxID=1240361 RepID=A0A8T1ZTG8_9BRAS|nr:Zinc finger CCHC-type superfamily [Arabidopsis thaliana x Arabidopsis arenosa]
MGDSSSAKGFVVPAIPRFDGHYDHWARLMENFIRSKEYWDLIENGISRIEGAVPTEAQQKVIDEQKLKDLKLKNFLYQSIDREILDTILNTDTSKQIWESMKQKFEGSTKVKRAQLQALRKEYETLQMREGETVNSYFARTLAIAKKMKTCGETLQENTISEKILRSLTMRFNYVVCSIEESNNLDRMTLDELQSSLLVHEQRMKGGPAEEEQVLKVSYEGRGRGRGSFRGRGRGRGSNRATIECFRCHKLGHYQSECPTWDNTAHYAELNEKEELLLMAFVEENKSQRDRVWFLDSGCSNHMTGDRSWFTNLDEKLMHTVRLGNDSRLRVQGHGSVKVILKGRSHIIPDVYYVPELTTNLLSLGQLQERKLAILIKDGSCKVFHNDWGLIIHTDMTANRMFVVLAETPEMSCLQTSNEEPNLWHKRFGHLNQQSLENLSKKEMVIGLPQIEKDDSVCEVCTKGKQHRETFPKQANWRATEKLQLIHTDLCGPIQPNTVGEKRYILSFIDDFSRKTWIYLLSLKSEAFSSFKSFELMVENEARMKIGCLRSDRGGEFTSKEFNEFCAANGIKRQVTAAFTPQQNGVAERRNRTIMNMVRCLLMEKGMPKKFWGEAASWTNHILNRCPTAAVQDKTPQECWTGLKPNVNHFKIFGCIGYAHVPSQKRVKLDDRGLKCVFLGVSEGSKAYKMFDPVTKTVVVSRDVVFDEEHKWNWEMSCDEEARDILVIEEEERDAEQFENITPEAVVDADIDANNEPQNATPTPNNVPSPQPQPRTRAPPRYLQDYERGDASTDEEEELQYVALYVSQDDPYTYEEAAEERKWRDAMDAEIESIEKNGTWELVELPVGSKKIGVKWVYKTKVNEKGEVDKFKARLVAKGYSQKHGVDYDEVFAPVARWDTIRMLLAEAAKRQWSVYQLDVKSAFLHGVLKETVFVEQPEGYEKTGEEHKVYKLHKALYGLKQAPRAWYSKIEEYFTKEGFTKCELEHTLFIKNESGGRILIISLYVDDLIFTGNDSVMCEEFKASMKREFEMTDLGKMCYFLGVEVVQSENGIFLCQKKYAAEVLSRYGMEDCNPVNNPMVPGTKLSKDMEGDDADPSLYKQLIGSLMYLTATRPDIMFTVCFLSRFMMQPKAAHLWAAKRVLRYIKGTLQMGLLYTSAGEETMKAYTDSDFAGDVDGGRSTSGYVFLMSNAAVAWSSKKQPIVTLSTTEAEYVAASFCATQCLWMKRILGNLSQTEERCVTILCDNSSSIKLSKNPILHGRTKHIKVRFHFLRELVKDEEVDLVHCGTQEQVADIMTKPLKLDTFVKLRRMLGVQTFQTAMR